MSPCSGRRYRDDLYSASYKETFRICGGARGLNPNLRVEAVPLSHFRYIPAGGYLLQNRYCDDNDTYVLQT